jgi:hypothetical protein
MAKPRRGKSPLTRYKSGDATNETRQPLEAGEQYLSKQTMR